MTNQSGETKSDISLKNFLASLAIPEDSVDISLHPYWPGSIHAFLQTVVTEQIATRVWKEWNPGESARIQQPEFRKAYTKLLSDGVSLGFSLNRFRESSRHLPDPGTNQRNWIPIFERAIAGRDTFGFRLFLNSGQYQQYANELRQNTAGEKTWQSMLKMMTDGLFYELGIIFPPVAVREDSTLVESEIRIEWNDLTLPADESLSQDQVLVNDTVERLRLLNIEGSPAVNPANGSECAFVSAEFADVCEQAGLTTWDYRGFTILKLSAAIRMAAGALVNRYFGEYLLNSLAQAFPELCRQFREKFDIDIFVRILRGLVHEEISIRDLRSILNALLAARSTYRVDLSNNLVFPLSSSPALFSAEPWEVDSLDVMDFVNHIRSTFKRYISHKYTRGQNTLVVYLLDREIEGRLRQRIPLTDEERGVLLKAIEIEVGSLPPTAQNPVILTTTDVRWRVRDEIQLIFPHLAVLSYQELSLDLNIQPIARLEADIQPLDESLYRFFEALPVLPESIDLPEVGSDQPSAPGSEIAELLSLESEKIIESVLARINQRVPSDERLQELIREFIEACIVLIRNRQPGHLQELLRHIAPVLAVEGVRPGSVCQIPLLITREARNLASLKYAGSQTEDAFDKVHQLSGIMDDADERITGEFSRAFLQSKYGGLIP